MSFEDPSKLKEALDRPFVTTIVLALAQLFAVPFMSPYVRKILRHNYPAHSNFWMTTDYMYREYRVRELINETIKSVMEAACSFDSDRVTVIDNSGDVHTEEQIDYSGEVTEESEGECSDSGLVLEVGDLARAHWIQLHKLNKQAAVLQNTFVHILENYKHIRPIWQFGLKIDDSNSDWKLNIYGNFYFRHHCASVQSAITMIMENMDDRDCLQKLLHEIGAHHFFYDACEPHLDIFMDALVTTMKKQLVGPSKMDQDAEQSWRLLLNDVKTFIGEGIAMQRNVYLRQCMTPYEMTNIRSKWEKIVEFGLQEAGEILCETAIKTYGKLIEAHNIHMVVPFERTSEVFSRFAEYAMEAFDVTVNGYSEETGFCTLPKKVKDFVVKCMILEMCPTFARRAMTEGLFTMLSKVFGEEEFKENRMRTWSKLYRVLEQAIIINIVEY